VSTAFSGSPKRRYSRREEIDYHQRGRLLILQVLPEFGKSLNGIYWSEREEWADVASRLEQRKRDAV